MNPKGTRRLVIIASFCDAVKEIILDIWPRARGPPQLNSVQNQCVRGSLALSLTQLPQGASNRACVEYRLWAESSTPS
jgi:hypothetical protein